MNSNTFIKRKKGQILLITLFVLTIMAIILTLTVRVIYTDRRLVDSSQDYEIFFNVSESITQDYIQSFASSTLSEIEQGCQQGSGTFNTFECSLVLDPNDLSEASGTESTGVVRSNIKVEDLSAFEINLAKDEAFTIELTEVTGPSSYISFTGTLRVNWDITSNIAYEVILIYFLDNRSPGQGTLFGWDSNIEPIYSNYGVYNKNFLNSTPNSNMVFSNVDNNQGFTLNILQEMQRFAPGNNSSAVPKSLVIIPRTQSESVNLAIRSNNAGDHRSGHPLPIQIRRITTESFDENDPSSSQTIVTTQFPRFPQPDTFFYYSILSQEPLRFP